MMVHPLSLLQASFENPKSESRNPKQARMTEIPNRVLRENPVMYRLESSYDSVTPARQRCRMLFSCAPSVSVISTGAKRSGEISPRQRRAPGHAHFCRTFFISKQRWGKPHPTDCLSRRLGRILGREDKDRMCYLGCGPQGRPMQARGPEAIGHFLDSRPFDFAQGRLFARMTSRDRIQAHWQSPFSDFQTSRSFGVDPF